MTTTFFKGTPVTTVDELPEVGTQAPDFLLTASDLGDVTLFAFDGKQLVLNVFPSIDTDVCAASVRRFNQLAADLPNTKVLCISADLPFAASRFCAAEGIENVVTLSSFRSTFGQDYGLTLESSPLKGLLARSVLVVDPQHQVTYTQLVPEITQEPDYDEVIQAASR